MVVGMVQKQVAAICAAVIIVIIGGRNLFLRGSEPAHAIDFRIGFDNSRSNVEQLPMLVTTAAQLGSDLGAEDTLNLYTVNSVCQEFYAGKAPDSRGKLQEMLIDHVRPTSTQKDGTSPLLFWRETVARSQQSARSSIFIFFTDGDNDDFSPVSQATLRQVIAQIQSNPRILRVIIVGAKPVNRAELRRIFEPLGDRFALYDADQIQLAGLLGENGIRR